MKKNTQTNINNTYSINKVRLLIISICIIICFIILFGRLFYIQFFKGSEYKQEAYNQQTTNQIISPKRGTIYGRNSEILAQSIAVDTVSINPGKVQYSSR